MKTFEVNRKQYKGKEFDFNLVCDLEDMGIQMEEMGQKTMSVIRAYFGACSGLGREAAGAELQAHIISGGDFAELLKVMSDEMNRSDFFRSLNERAKEKDTTVETAEGTKAEPKKENWEE